MRSNLASSASSRTQTQKPHRSGLQHRTTYNNKPFVCIRTAERYIKCYSDTQPSAMTQLRRSVHNERPGDCDRDIDVCSQHLVLTILVYYCCIYNVVLGCNWIHKPIDMCSCACTCINSDSCSVQSHDKPLILKNVA